MSVHLNRQMDLVKKLILEVGSMVEQAFQDAMTSLRNRDMDLAREVIEGDAAIDVREVDVEEVCLATLALHQPVAHDLRFVVACLKINNDLERIGDLAVSIAEQGIHLSLAPKVLDDDHFGIAEMASRTQVMLKQALDSLVQFDAGLAQMVRQDDDRVDELHSEVYHKVQQRLEAQPDQADQMIRVLTIAKHIERSADHSVNIAKDVLYLVKGEIVRHARKRAAAQAAKASGKAVSQKMS